MHGRFTRWITCDVLRLGRTPVVVPLCYAVLGLCASAAEKFEVFPFFSWFLFAVTPNQIIQYELTPSPQLSALGTLLVVDLHVLVQRFGRALETKDRHAEQLRRRLESNFFVSPCDYVVTRTESDPIARWLDGTIESRQRVAEFPCLEGP